MNTNVASAIEEYAFVWDELPQEFNLDLSPFAVGLGNPLSAGHSPLQRRSPRAFQMPQPPYLNLAAG